MNHGIHGQSRVVCRQSRHSNRGVYLLNAVESDRSLRERKFVAFVAKMIELDPRASFADVTRLRSLSREDQPFAAFLVVLVELPETARVLVERLGDWKRMVDFIDQAQDPAGKAPAEFFQEALDGNGEWTRLDFGRGQRGAYRKPPHRPQFGEALYQYLLRVKSSGSPLALSTNDCASWV